MRSPAPDHRARSGMPSAIAALAGAAFIAFPAAAAPQVERTDPRWYDITMEAAARPAWGAEPPPVTTAEVVLPLILDGAYSRIDEESFLLETGQRAPRGGPVASLAREIELERETPLGTAAVTARLGALSGGEVVWRTRYRVTAWSSVADEAALARITWPRDWPASVQAALKPQVRIESDAEIFSRGVQDAIGEELRFTAPYLAAKTIVAYCVRHFEVPSWPDVHANLDPIERQRRLGDRRRHLEPDDEPRHPDPRVRRLLRHRPNAPGSARLAAERGYGNPAELTLVCVATLRAAGIPARAVSGVWAHETGIEPRVTWGELYLPGAGWVPFDPDVMQRNVNTAVRTVHDPWPGFGTVPELHRMIPIAYGFGPVDEEPVTIVPGVAGRPGVPGRRPVVPGTTGRGPHRLLGPIWRTGGLGYTLRATDGSWQSSTHLDVSLVRRGVPPR